MATKTTKRTEAGRNDPCPCGSGKKYKQCCLEKDEAAASAERAKAAKEAAKKAKSKESTEDADKKDAGSKGPVPARSRKPDNRQPWKKGGGQAHSTQRKSLPRKTGGG